MVTVAVLATASLGFGSPVMTSVDIDEVANALRRDPVYVDPGAERALNGADAAQLREAIAEAGTPVYVAVLPASADDAFGGDPAALASDLADTVGQDGTYAVVVGDSLRAGSSVLPAGRAGDLAIESLAAGGDDTMAVLVDFVGRVAAEAPSPTSVAAVANDPELELLLLTLTISRRDGLSRLPGYSTMMTERTPAPSSAPNSPALPGCRGLR